MGRTVDHHVWKDHVQQHENILRSLVASGRVQFEGAVVDPERWDDTVGAVDFPNENFPFRLVVHVYSARQRFPEVSPASPATLSP